MKTILLLFLCALAVHAQKEPACDSQNALVNVITLIHSGVEQNQIFIERESLKMTANDRRLVYEAHKRSSTFDYVIVNFVFGAGTGSFLQGEKSSGISLLLMEGASWTMIFTGSSETSLKIGIGTLIASRVMGIIFPIVDNVSYNRSLRKALHRDQGHLSVAPLVTPDGSVGLAVALLY